MIKKSLLALALSSLVGCSSLSLPNLGREPLYKISDQDVKEWINQVNQVEHCIYPQLKGLSWEDADKQVYSKQSKTENYALVFLSHVTILPNVIGENATQILHSDETSRKYLSKKHKEFNHNNLTQELDTKTCNQLKKEFKQAVSQAEKMNL